MGVGARLNKLPHDRESHLPIYFSNSFPLGPVIQVTGAHSLYKIMWERPTDLCVLSVQSVRASGGKLSSVRVCVQGRRGTAKRGCRAAHDRSVDHAACQPACLWIFQCPAAFLHLGKSRVCDMTPNKSSLISDRPPAWTALNTEL